MKVRARARQWLHYGGDLLAPLCRRFAGSITPVNPWRHYAEDLVAPLRRRRIGSIMPAIHTQRGRQLRIGRPCARRRRRGDRTFGAKSGSGSKIHMSDRLPRNVRVDSTKPCCKPVLRLATARSCAESTTNYILDTQLGRKVDPYYFWGFVPSICHMLDSCCSLRRPNNALCGLIA